MSKKENCTKDTDAMNFENNEIPSDAFETVVNNLNAVVDKIFENKEKVCGY